MKGYLGDALMLVIVLVVLFMGVYLWFAISPVMSAAFGDPGADTVMNNVNLSFLTLDNYLPYLYGVMAIAVVAVFAVIPIARPFVFIFALLFLMLGVFMTQFEGVVVQLLTLMSVPMPNLLYLIGQSKMVMIIVGISLIIVGFVRGEK